MKFSRKFKGFSQTTTPLINLRFLLSGITNPLSHRPRKRYTRVFPCKFCSKIYWTFLIFRLILFSIWLISLIFALPLMLFYKYELVLQDDVETPFCFIPQSPSMILFHTIYSVTVICIQYLIPLSIISYSYLKICYKLNFYSIERR